MMRNDNFLLSPSHRTLLDKAYTRYINNLLETLNEEETNRWEIYQAILKILINEGKSHYLTELKYRISDGENPNAIILNFIDREGNNIDGFVWSFKKKLEEFLDEDYFKNFIK